MDENTPIFFIGTSGWTYDHWRGCFYPPDLPKTRWLDHYAARFNAVEVNSTFYRAFPDQTYLKWKERAPRDFGYVLKAPKTITHRKLLRGVEEEIRAFCRSTAVLEEKFEMILLQVAPNLPYDLGLLRTALLAFTDPARVAVEFRSPQWLNRDVENLLTETEAAFCNVDSPSQRLTAVVTSERAYIRLHGRGHWYSYNYSPGELNEIAAAARDLTARGAKRVYVFFNNDFGGYAPANALALQEILAG